MQRIWKGHPETVWENFFVGAAIQAHSHYRALSGHFTAKESGLAEHYADKAWYVLNAHYFGRGPGWAGTWENPAYWARGVV